MDLGTYIKKAREAKGLSQKQIALSCNIDNSNYSRIENGKTDPQFSAVAKIAKAMDIELFELFNPNNNAITDVNSVDKSLMEKLNLIEQLDKKEKQAFFAVLDAFVSKKKLKDALQNVLTDVG